VTLQWFFLGDFSQVKNFLKTTLDPPTGGRRCQQLAATAATNNPMNAPIIPRPRADVTAHSTPLAVSSGARLRGDRAGEPSRPLTDWVQCRISRDVPSPAAAAAASQPGRCHHPAAAASVCAPARLRRPPTSVATSVGQQPRAALPAIPVPWPVR
jgi:hypothetical protein